MWRLYFLRLAWLPLVVLPLQFAAACLPLDSSPLASISTPGLIQSHPMSSDALCEAPSFNSGELSLQSENQSKQRLMSTRCGALLSGVQQAIEDLSQPVMASLGFPACQFFPRKLSPRPTDDDPPVLG
jgi:hypothetical protein